jgi:ligand-binding sensor protein
MFPDKDLQLTDFVNLSQWQKVQDSFAEVLEISLKTLSLEGRLLTNISRPNYLCNKILPNNPVYIDFCGSCISKQKVQAFADIKEVANFKCSFSLDLFVVPITMVSNRTIAYIVVGPLFLNRRKDISEFVDEAKKTALSLDDLMDALVEINVFSYNKVYSINNLLKDVFSYMAQTGYHKKRLGEMVPEIMEMDPLFGRYYEEKILNSVLNACTLALNADSGSVMTMDEKTHTLHVKVASKLDEDIVNKTNIKLGEGIAGVAAAKAEPIVLPEDENRCGLSEQMKRKYIKSSLIVPFPKSKNHQVYGVINLNIVRKNIHFSKKDIAFVEELVNLASVALIPFREATHN